MAYKKIIILSFLLNLFAHLSAQEVDENCKKIEILFQTLKENHYKPPNLNKEFAEQIHNNIIENLDPFCIYFTKKDIKKLSFFEQKTDDEIEILFCDYEKKLGKIFKKRLLFTDSVINILSEIPYDFTKKDSIIFVNNRCSGFAENEKDLIKNIRTVLKYKSLKRLLPEWKIKKKTSDNEIVKFLQKETEIRKIICTKEKCKIKQILNHYSGFETYIGSIVLNITANNFDPHTTYFTKEEFQNFKSYLSKTSYSFGINFYENKNGDIEITNLTPGGAAWKSNKLQEGDILTSLKLENEEIFEPNCSGINEVKKILNISNKIEITVRKINGQTKTVMLLKEKIMPEENLINSLLLTGKEKIAYISLPSFYSDSELINNGGCADDMAREIIKLRKENIKGIIIDLRFNGGGYMKEAVNLAGIFIEEGTLCVTRTSSKISKRQNVSDIDLLKDKNRGTIYDAPLIILVNRASASASEMLAGTLKDYNRALIVGTPTFGKATAQIVIPLGQNVDSYINSDFYPNSDKGFLKITVGKLYRITGKSHQITGVLPDVFLPDLLDENYYNEGNFPYAFRNDSINKKIYYNPLEKIPVKYIAEMSEARIDTIEKFKQIYSVAEQINNYFSEKLIIHLDTKSYLKEKLKYYELLQKSEEIIVNNSSPYKVENTKYDEEIIGADKTKKKINNIVKKKIKEDIYLQETYRIMLDLIKYK